MEFFRSGLAKNGNASKTILFQDKSFIFDIYVLGHSGNLIVISNLRFLEISRDFWRFSEILGDLAY